MLIFADYDGFIVKETEHAIGLGTKAQGEVELWLPKSQIGRITYSGGDNELFFINTRIEAIEIPEWLAREKGLSDD